VHFESKRTYDITLAAFNDFFNIDD